MSWVAIRRQLPNALTLARFAAIPVFAWLYLEAGDGPAWGAGVFFAGAALTDQLDGYLARRWHVESQFGKVADPLADRLMIDAAVIILVAVHHRLPWVALVIIVARDALLIGGYKFLMPRGYELDVGLGLAKGFATIGAIGFEGRWDYGAIGSVTNLAFRLCSEARPGQVLATRRVVAAVEDLVETEVVGDLALKGFARPVSTVALLKLRSP